MATSLVEGKLIACANIYDGVTSIYEWEGKIRQSQEFTLICKTADKNVDEVIKTVTSLHSYSCPCVVAVRVEKGNQDFVKWVEGI